MSAISEIEKDQKNLYISWQDGHKSQYAFRYLRENCPCAMCRDEFTGERILDVSTIPSDLVSQRESVVGHYALAFSFSDGHGAGIYTFEYLREICSCSDCAFNSHKNGSTYA